MSAEQSDAATHAAWIDKPTHAHGWWHVAIKTADCTMSVVQVCSETDEGAKRLGLQKLEGLRGARRALDDIWVIGMAPDASCANGDVAAADY